MTSLKTLRGRIRSIHSTKKITKAMQLISAARLRQIRIKKDDAMEYINQFKKMLFILYKNNKEEFISSIKDIFIQKSKNNFNTNNLINNNNIDDDIDGNNSAKLILWITISSDKGLCGCFNTSVFRTLNTLLINSNNSHINNKININNLIICIGKKCYEAMKKKHLEFGNTSIVQISTKKINVKNIDYQHIESISNEIANIISQTQCEIIECNLIYNDFISILKYETKLDKIFPITELETSPNLNIKTDSSLNAKTMDFTKLYDYEPNLEKVLKFINTNYLTVKLYNAILTSILSEYSARMMAMDNATRNSEDLLNKLKTQYNQNRQAGITKELIEIIAGVQALDEA